MTLSLAVAKKQRKELDTLRDKGHRAGLRAQLIEVRNQIKLARAEKKDRLSHARQTCRLAKRAHLDRARALRLELAQKLRAAILAERHAVKNVCLLDREAARKKGDEEVLSARQRAAAEARYQRELRSSERHAVQRQRARTLKTAKERRKESDGEVENNLPPELLAMWQRAKKGIKGSDRRSRTEEFLEYASENPDQVVESQQDDADRQVKELLAKEAELVRQMKRRGRQSSPLRKTRAAHSFASLPPAEAVPF